MRTSRSSPRTNGARAAPWSSARRETSRIHVLQTLRNVTAAALVTGSRPLTRDVEVDNQPSLESDGLQHSMAGRKIYLAVPQVGDAFAIETVRSGARQAAGILVIRQHDPALVLFECLRHIAAGQVKVRRVRREIEQLRI